MATAERAYRFDSGPTLADRFRTWAGTSERVYPYAVRAMADDWEAAGPVRAVCAGYEHSPNGAAIQLRLLAGVFRLVLTGRADALRPFYACLGGTAEPAGIWPVLWAVITEHVDELHEALRIAPQTNEVGRSAALLVGLYDLVAASGRTRIRLLEVGASAGLNLLVDRFRFTGDDWSAGPEDSPLRLEQAVRGHLRPLDFLVTERRGCDLHPIDPATAAGRLMLSSFVWPDDVHRFDRLEAALAVVDRFGAPPVDQLGAADWLRVQLDRADEEGVLSVVWNSITQQYWPSEEVAAVADLLAVRGATAPLAQVSLEFRHDADPGPPEIRTRLWTGAASPRERLLGHAHHHGLPVELGGPVEAGGAGG